MHLRLLIAIAASGCAAQAAPVGTGTAAGPGGKADGWDHVECAFPSARIADSAATAWLAAQPERCGQAAYTWRTDGVGQLVSIGEERWTPEVFLRFVSWWVDVPLHRPVEHAVGTTEIEYTTQARGEIVTATALVAHPTDIGPTEGPLDIVLFLHGTTGFSDGCGASDNEGYASIAKVIAAFGYVVVMPDYIGLKQFGDASAMVHPYLVGEPTAMAALDAVRAAAALPGVGQRGFNCIAPRVLVFGVSQGGHAALWVDRLAPYYAPELELIGTVAAVPPSDLFGQAQRALTELVPASANIAAVLATSAEWYGAGGRLDEVFAPPYDELIPAELRTSCGARSLGRPAALSDLFAAPLLESIATGTPEGSQPWQCILRENGLVTTSIPRIDDGYGDGYEILFVLGEHDSLVDTAIERSAFEDLCDQGMAMRYLECAGAGHEEGAMWALPEILQFLEDKASGAAPLRTCVRSAPTQCTGTPAP